MSDDNTGKTIVLPNFGGLISAGPLDSLGFDGHDVLASIVLFFATVTVTRIVSPILPGWAPWWVMPTFWLGAVSFGAIYIMWIVPPSETPIMYGLKVVRYRWMEKAYVLGGTVEGTGDVENVVNIDRIRHTEGGPVAVRDDGTVTAGVQVNGKQMALADDEEWVRAAREFGAFINKMRFSAEIFSTGRHVNVSEIVGNVDDRLEMDVVQENDKLFDLIEGYAEQMPQMLDHRGANVREYYAMIEATDADVVFEDSRIERKMSRIPVVGGFFERFLLLTDETDEDYIEHRKYEIIQEQIESITTDLGSIGGISVDRLDEDDLLVLNEEYWTGEKLPRHYDNIVHRTPVVTVDSGVDHTDIEDKDSRSLEEEIEQISEQVAEEVESESPVQGGAVDGDGGAVSAATGGD